MNTILDYLTIDILTMYENNIKLHYVEYVERYVNVVWKKKLLKEKIKRMGVTQKERKARIYRLCNQLRNIKSDLLNVETTNYKSHSAYHEWINQQKQFITPNKAKYLFKSTNAFIKKKAFVRVKHALPILNIFHLPLHKMLPARYLGE